MLSSFLENRRKKKITNEFKDYLVMGVLSFGEILDQRSNKESILEHFISAFLEDISPRKQILVDEILKRVSDQNTQRDKLV